MYYIYKITNKINWKTYIGQTTQKNPKTRWKQHKRVANKILEKNENYINRHDYFHNAIAKHGSENFKFEIIDTAETLDELNEKERKWIYYYNSDKRKYGYNTEQGGRKFIAEEHREEHSKNLSKKIKEVFNKKPQLRKALSDMQKERIKKGINPIVKKGKEHPFSRDILQLDLNGNIIKEFAGSFEADRETGINQAHIIKCCKNKQITAGNYFWVYKEDYSKEKIEKLKENLKNKHSYCSIKVKVYDINNNQLIDTFTSIKKAAEFINTHHTQLSYQLKRDNGKTIIKDKYYIIKNI